MISQNGNKIQQNPEEGSFRIKPHVLVHFFRFSLIRMRESIKNLYCCFIDNNVLFLIAHKILCIEHVYVSHCFYIVGKSVISETDRQMNLVRFDMKLKCSFSNQTELELEF